MVSSILQGPREVHVQTERRDREIGAGVEGIKWKLVEQKVLSAKVIAAKADLFYHLCR